MFDTKVRSALLLSRKLKLDELSFLVFFSSMSGRFGNRGQCDYAAANEVLNKLALSWIANALVGWCPSTGAHGRVAWSRQSSRSSSPNMAWSLFHASVGRKSMDQELCWGRKGEVEVLLGGIEAGTTSNAADA